MKQILFSLAYVALVSFAHAQGSLQFNAAKIITNSSGVQTVPTGKVWKVMSVYGKNSVTAACLALPAYCVNSSWPTSSISNVKGKGYKVNGTVVWQTVDLSETVIYYQFNDCTGATTSTSSQAGCVTAINQIYPNQTFDELAATLPFWIPEGYTLETLGTTSNISLLEFNIVP